MARTAYRFLLAALCGLTFALTSAGAASAGGLNQLTTADKAAAKSDTAALTSVNCSSIRELNRAYGQAPVIGGTAFTVRQYIGWCWDSIHGSAWMNFSSVYVWDWYHNRQISYRAEAGISRDNHVVIDGAYGYDGLRRQLTFSQPWPTASIPTQGWGKLTANGVTVQVFTPTAY